MNNKKEKILLALLPFWEPLIPPIGISCLKSHLLQYGYNVKTVDGNIFKDFNVIYNRYFDTLKDYIPKEKWGNFHNIGKDLLRNHMMAHINFTDEKVYMELVRILINKTFFCDVAIHQARELKQIVDAFYASLENYFLRLLAEEKPSVLGLSVYRGNLPASLLAFRLAREHYPHVKTVMGGGVFADQLAMGSPDLEFFLEKTKRYIDKIIIGEGEILFHKLLTDELPASKRVYTIRDINEEILDLSTVNIPEYTDFDLQYYPCLALYASRSCPFQCSFCSETLQWGKYRKKDIKQVVKESLQLNKKYGFQLFLMSDSLLNPIVTDFSNELIRAGISIYWDGYLRIDREVCDVEKTSLWRRGGFYRARLGVESGSQRILDLMNKKITVDQTRAGVSSLARAGIKTTTYWLVGYPGETEEEFQQTLDLMEELKDDIYEAWCNLYWYYINGQVKSEVLAKNSILFYPENAKDMLILETRVAGGEPSKEVMTERLFRFIKHCNFLGIPNIYSLRDINQADKRWNSLHQNATPPLINFMDKGTCIDENKNVKKINFAKNTLRKSLDFCFE